MVQQSQTFEVSRLSMILHCIAPNVRHSSELCSPAYRLGGMFYSFVIYKSVWSSGLCKGIPWWNCNIAAGVYATINLLICPQGHALGLLQSLAQVRNAKVQRDAGNIMVGRRKRVLLLYTQMSHWDRDPLLWTQVFSHLHPTCSWWQERFGSCNTLP